MAKEKQEQTGLQIMAAPEVTDLIEKNQFDLTEAESLALGYAPLMKEVLEQTSIIKKLDKTKSEDAAIAKRASLDLGKICSKLETKKKEDKSSLLIRTRIIDGLFNVAEGTARLGQADAKEKYEYQDNLLKEAAEKLKTERLELLAPFEVDTEFLPLDIMDEEKFQTLLAKSKESFEAVKAKREQDEKDRIAAEKKAEEDRLAEIEAEKQRQIERDKENERLKKEAEAREKELAKERAEAEKKAKEQEVLRQQEQAKADAILKAEREAREKVEAELEAKRVQEEAEKQQAIAEQQERDAKAKAALLAPDKEKINALYLQIKNFAFPECSTPEAQAIITDIADGFKIILEGIKTKSQTLK